MTTFEWIEKRANGKTNEKAVNALARVMEAQEKIEVLKAYFENHMEENPEEINWGHVGNAAHTVELLNEMHEFLGIKDRVKKQGE